MKKLNYVLVLVACVLSVQAWSQNLKEFVSISSPTAASLGSYGDADVNLFSGAVSPSIPICEIRDGSLTLPVSLQYKGSGVRTEEYPGWVGSNWSLNAGGAVTRVVKGIPDESYLFLKNWNEVYDAGYVWTTYLDDAAWNTQAKLKTLAMGDYPGGKTDTEPDEFIFNVNGISGKFYLKPQATWFQAGDPTKGVFITRDVTVVGSPGVTVEFELRDECIAESTCSTLGYLVTDEYEIRQYRYATMFITGFRITTEDGKRYSFGGIGDMTIEHPEALESVEFSLDFFSKGYIGETMDTWYLTEMKTLQNESIIFTYEHGAPIASFTKSIVGNKESGSQYSGLFFGFFGTTRASQTSFTTSYSGRLIRATYLKKIETRNQVIEFNTSVSVQKKYPYTDILNHLVQIIYDGGGDYMMSYIPADEIEFGAFKTVPRFTFDLEARAPIWGSPADFGQPDVYAMTRYDLPLAYECDMDSYDWDTNTCSVYEGYAFVQEIIDMRKLQWYQLDKISVKDKNNSIFKEYKLKYSADPNERLTLLQLQENDAQGNMLSPYLFEYENYNNPLTPAGISKEQTGNTRKLPGYCGFSYDHWGYYQGSDDPASPKYSFGLNFNDENTLNAGFYNYRNPDANYLYTGTLNRITYPTGGYTSFIYEPHKYTKIVNRNGTGASEGTFYLSTVAEKMAGGLRLKEQRNYQNNGTLITSKSYEYTNGVLGGDSKYFWKDYDIDLYYYDVGDRRNEESSADYRATRFITHSVLPVSTNSVGTYIGYSKVVEKNTGNGRREYYYTNHENSLTGIADILDEKYLATINLGEKTKYTPFSSLDFQRGLLKESRTYSEGNVLLEKTVNTYGPNTFTNGQFMKSAQNQYTPVSLCQLCFTIEATAYKLYTYSHNLISSEQSIYDNGVNPVVTTKNITFNKENFISTETSTSSKGVELKTEYTYPRDVDKYTGTSAPSNPVVWALLNMARVPPANAALNMLNYPVETVKSVNGKVVEATVQTFRSFPQGSVNIKPDQVSMLEVPDGITNYTRFTMTTAGALTQDARLKPRVTFANYDASGNLLEFNNLSADNTAIIYNTNGSLPIAKVVHATSNQVYYNSFEDLATGFTTDAIAGSKALSGSFTVPLPAAGGTFKLTYWRKTSGVWALVEDTMSAAKVIGGTGIIVDEIRVCPAAAQMTSYTYIPNLGISTMNDVNNNIAYYEYDSFGRLMYIRDMDRNIVKKFEYHIQVR